MFDQTGKGIMRVSPNGGTPERLVSVKDGEFVHGAQILPGGQAVLFTLATGAALDRWDKAQVVVQSLKTGERKILVGGGSDARYVSTGHIVYALGGTVFAIPFDLRRLQVKGGRFRSSKACDAQYSLKTTRVWPSSAFQTQVRWCTFRDQPAFRAVAERLRRHEPCGAHDRTGFGAHGAD